MQSIWHLALAPFVIKPTSQVCIKPTSKASSIFISNSHFGLLEPEIERVWELSGGGRLNIF